MKVIIIDDEAPVLRLTKHVLKSFADVQIIGEYTDSSEGLRAIREMRPDICFLDIEMPGLNGIEVAKELIDLNVHVIFVTAYEQYAVQAFKVNAVDYILKPISLQEVERVLNKLRPRVEHVDQHMMVDELRIDFFGEFQVIRKGVALEWPTEKASDLFAYFVYHTGHKVEKWKLCDILWPDLLPEKAMHNLYNAMYLLKKVLDTHEINYSITNKRGYYEFTIEKAFVDFVEMEQQLLKLSEKEEPMMEELELLEALYQGEFLSRKDYQWCQPVRAYYEQVYTKWVKQLLYFYVQHRIDEKAILIGRKILQMYPDQEDIAVTLMPIYLEKGRLALEKFYKEYSAHFEEELQIPLSPNTKKTYEHLKSNQKLTH